MWLRSYVVLCGLGACLFAAGVARPVWLEAQNAEPNFSDDQKKSFLLSAKIIASKQIGKGSTHPWRLTLSDGTVTHDAAFQPVDIRKDVVQFSAQPGEIGFRDSFHYNIAAYELAKLIGMDDLIPVTVQRKWNGDPGALAWWIDAKWDEQARRKERAAPPDADRWNRQIDKIRLCIQLFHDTDPNLGNMLITEDWHVWRIDFTRAFRLRTTLLSPDMLQHCDRRVLEKLRQLTAREVMERTQPHLTDSEVKALLARRDKIVEIFQQLIVQKGEDAVLY